MLEVTGILIAIDWNEDGEATRFQVSTYNEDEFLLDCGKITKAIVNLIRKEVVVRGRRPYHVGNHSL